MDDPKFRASGFPIFLEWYKCYRDPTQRELIDGMELKDNPDWDASQVARWRFFYRIDPRHLGDPQRQEIRNFQEGIKNAARDCEIFKKKTNSNFEFFTQSVVAEIWNLNRKSYNISATCMALMLVLYYFAEQWAILPILYLLVHFAYTFSKKKELAKSKTQKKSQNDLEIQEMQQKTLEKIEVYNRKIREFEDEIRILQTKIPESPDAARMEADLKGEIEQIERFCLGEIVNTSTARDAIQEQVDNPVMEKFHQRLIQGWGLLQQPTIQGPFGIEKTGLERVRRDLGPKIATWRPGTKKQPVFRVLYLQYIFLLKKSISMYGFFYDVITRKHYGARSETFHYNHVANFSIKAAELEVPDWLQELHFPESFIKNLFGKEVNIFSLTVSSGTHFRCTLIDTPVIDAMNNWLREDGKSDADELLVPIQSDKDYGHIANEILKQVREGVEQYDYWVRPVNPARSDG